MTSRKCYFRSLSPYYKTAGTITAQGHKRFPLHYAAVSSYLPMVRPESSNSVLFFVFAKFLSKVSIASPTGMEAS
jgi:hypothetical protein